MKAITRISLIIISFLTLQSAFAQVEDQFNSKPFKEKPTVKKVYLGIGTGIDNITGLLGPIVEVNLIDNLTTYGAAGLGSWGYKISGGAKYYIKYPFKWAFNVGFSHATGLDDFPIEIETQNNPGTPQEVIMDLKPSNTINISALYNFKLGKKNRFSLELGYAFPITNDYYTIQGGHTLTKEAETVMQILQPGGIIIGVSFSFGL